MAGNQVLEWTDIDSELKTAGLANVWFSTELVFESADVLLIGSFGATRFVSDMDVDSCTLVDPTDRLVNADFRYVTSTRFISLVG